MSLDTPAVPSNAFRANVGVILRNSEGSVLACERSDHPGAWQMPQGGIRQGEEPLDAALREITEETAIPATAVEFVAEYPEWIAYELPKEKRGPKWGRGQVQKWFLFSYQGRIEDIRFDSSNDIEFVNCKWMPLAELAGTTVPFRRPVYTKLAEHFAGIVR